MFSLTLLALLLAHGTATGCHGDPLERSRFVDLHNDWMRFANMAPVASELLAEMMLFRGSLSSVRSDTACHLSPNCFDVTFFLFVAKLLYKRMFYGMPYEYKNVVLQ